LPSKSIQFCLAQAKIDVTTHEAVVYYEKLQVKFECLFETYLVNVPYGFISFQKAIPIWLKEKLYFQGII